MKFVTARESNDCQTIDWMNSITFKASLFAKHQVYQTLSKCINASIVVLSHADIDVNFFVDVP